MEGIKQSISSGNRLADLYDEIRAEHAKIPSKIVILDDDPTGSQTVYDVSILTDWKVEVLDEMFRSDELAFFIVTNSRSLSGSQANKISKEIADRCRKLALKYEQRLILISRSDSTLRGHFQEETEAISTDKTKLLFVPAFFEGGRYTYGNIHYVKENEAFQKANDTAFAKDKTFGYSHADLKLYIEEKTDGMVQTDEVFAISIEDLRRATAAQILRKIDQENNRTFIANATSYFDLQKLALAVLSSKSELIFRTSASFINAIAAIPPRKPLDTSKLTYQNQNGGLVIIGSYVPKTTAQLEQLMQLEDLVFIKMEASSLISKSHKNYASIADKHISQGKTVVVFTSRVLLSAETKEESLKLINLVAEGVNEVVSSIRTKPRFMITKGGITSSDIATKVLKIKKTKVIGQALPGVPIWKHKNFPYIIFPGNVGDDNALFELVQKLMM